MLSMRIRVCPGEQRTQFRASGSPKKKVVAQGGVTECLPMLLAGLAYSLTAAWKEQNNISC